MFIRNMYLIKKNKREMSVSQTEKRFSFDKKTAVVNDHKPPRQANKLPIMPAPETDCSSQAANVIH